MRHKFNIFIALFLLLSIANFAKAYIECYKCPLEPDDRRKEYIDCPAFDGSLKFKVQCYTSTFCEKKITHLTIANGTTITRVVHRGCAPQNDPEHYLKNKQWELRDNIQRYLYEPGCVQDIDKNSPTGPATYCYCNTHYCNGISSLHFTSKLIIFIPLALVTSYLL
ncbi:uncharacterized protein LOC122512950 isoform X1 [Leptopilina heterotoma]|uniref:uncharacterized protein LOC122512950 isoform X1 n=1 Tax=Leptopilina heterotoma TaxID=63436 RepID=UPI001CA9CC59|nr:uncharacterized protein LOC122512950 isoform X1 [Leptopilina heterotoma]XP_043485080.1 uncharacterized protein LOC122512950 isoform X1 [Leptopilina heterotoma]XP_043485088.1 uncharacterized protein LOC122512950 isoform X1 [Leptopilina heterotoma]XP_043485093.1 uncharacterized protein LOC122512950 isoform X1 [Leptopilina heterotoma]XP_043485102.1 uncharacterized protein LOC122512950 isoform X1 [Leptopilina heterotoma]XP_043485112.1 uncharacterized protein LOC122512950 isoform X1 [Leptopilina